MRNGLRLYWFLLMLLLPVFAGVTLLLSFRTKFLVTQEVIHGFDQKLIEIISLTEGFLDQSKHHRLQPLNQVSEPIEGENEEDSLFPSDYSEPYYLQTVEVFKRIRRTTGLSYLYSFRLIGENGLYYVLDGSEPDDFTPIGTKDDPPEGFSDEVESLVQSPHPVVKPIKMWENWGLIKSGFIPIILSNGKTDGFVGADLAVDIIKVREKQAILALFFFGVTGIIISFFAAVRIAGELVLPINRLKGNVVQLAGGNLDIKFSDLDVREFDRLTTVFQEVQTQMSQLDSENTTILQKQISVAANDRFHDYIKLHLLKEIQLSSVALKIEAARDSGFLGNVETDKAVYFWHFLTATDGSIDVKSAKIALLTRSFAGTTLSDWDRFLQSMEARKDLNLFLLDKASGELCFSLAEQFVLEMNSGQGSQVFRGNGSLQSSECSRNNLQVVLKNKNTHSTVDPQKVILEIRNSL